MDKRILIPISYALITFFISACANKESDDSTVYEDLQKLAKVVSTFSMKTTETRTVSQNKPVLHRSKHETLSNTSTDLPSNTLVDEYTDEAGSSITREEFFLIDGTTPLDFSLTDEVDSYIIKVETSYLTPKYHADSTYVTTVQKSPGGGFFLLNSESIGVGRVDYYNDDLVLSIEKLYLKLDENSVSVRFDISLMEQKYFFSLEQSITIEDILAAVESGESASKVTEGEIKDGNGNVVGTFVLNSDESVTILDANGEIVKTAGE